MNLANSIPKKSKRYYLGEAVIRRQFNEIEFYFEDEKQQEMYFLIAKKLFGNAIKFDKIFITCGKDGAYEMLDKNINRNNKRKIFILDKDFDDLLRKKKRSIHNLFYLNKYSIENYLIEQEAILWLLIFQKPTTNRDILALNFDALINATISDLQLLTCYFFIANKLKLNKYIDGFASCSIPIEIFLQINDKSLVDASKVEDYWQSIKQAISDYLPGINSVILLESAKRSVLYNELGVNGIYKHIPGKHFFELLRKKINKIFPFMNSLKSGQMKYALASRCEFESLNLIKQEIISYLEIS